MRKRSSSKTARSCKQSRFTGLGHLNVSANKRVMEILKPYISEELRSIYAKFKPFLYKTADFTKLDVKLSSLEMRELFGTDSANFSSKPDGVDSTQADLDKYCNLYLGQWNKRSNKPEGFGVALYKFKGLYEGFWKKGKPHSFGKMFYLNGEVYQGQWKKGEIHGYGIFLKNAVKNKDSTKLVNNQNEQKINAHQGFWVQGKANGIGFQKFADGSTFLGTFEDNKK
uniref:MORN repeat protein n=1 Tax=Euplotes harpa TaxID=151035 RepID=A0A7S3J671_9SPIT|mmetsp:Transcript_17184/g.19871  ORF Transcript_17184/g.19871 Transcript_17184/m.19871 type:complete len:226 (+) Transcript_17184:226-903(+)